MSDGVSDVSVRNRRGVFLLDFFFYLKFVRPNYLFMSEQLIMANNGKEYAAYLISFFAQQNFILSI